MPGLRKHLSQCSPLLPALGPPTSSPHQRGNGKASSRWFHPPHWLPLSLVFSSGDGHPACRHTLAPLRCEEHSAQHRLRTRACASLQHTRRQADAVCFPASRKGAHPLCSGVGHPGCPCPCARRLGLEFAGAGGA